MKKLFFAVVALAMVATSCSKDESVAPEATAKTFTFTVKAPEMQTRAAGDGKSATTLYYAFYDESGLLATLPNSTTGDTWTPLTGKSLEVTLVEGKTYSAIFVAVNADAGDDAPYKVDLTAKTMTIDYSKVKCNSEANDAFYKYVGGITSALTGDQNVELKRPFAQLNIGAPTTDITAAENAGLTINSVKVGATVANVLNLVDGTVSGEAPIEFGWATKGAESFTHESTTYTILATTYVLVDGTKNLATVGFHMSEAANGSDPIDREFSAVPIERNHRTFVLGNIVTNADAALKYVIKVAPGFETGDNVVDEKGNAI